MKLDKGFYYVNSFEPYVLWPIESPISFIDLIPRFISTMETETVSSRNIVDLLLKEEFNASICGLEESDSDLKNDASHTSEATSTRMQDEGDYVYGWDC